MLMIKYVSHPNPQALNDSLILLLQLCSNFPRQLTHAILPRNVGYEMQTRGGSQAMTITGVTLSSPPKHVHHLRRDHHVTHIPLGAYPLPLERVPA